MRGTVAIGMPRYRHSRHAWEPDRKREREARQRGDEFRRYSRGEVLEWPGWLPVELQRLLSSAPATASPA